MLVFSYFFTYQPIIGVTIINVIILLIAQHNRRSLTATHDDDFGIW
jgi:hypothetical protein